MKHVFVAGAGGMAGAQISGLLVERGFECTALTRDALDITDADAVQEAVSRTKPDVVINAAGYTAVDRAESNREQAMMVNAIGPLNLALAAAAVDAPIIHVSSDYVFDGRSHAPYAPDAQTNPASVYGQSKLEGEFAIRESGARHAIVRTQWVYSHTKSNFLRAMLAKGAQGGVIRVVNDQTGSPTSAADLAGALVTVAMAMRENPDLGGTWHFANAGTTTWFGFAQAIFEMRGLDVSLEPVSTVAFGAAAPRPANSALDTSTFEQTFNVVPRPWRDALRDTLAMIP